MELAFALSYCGMHAHAIRLWRQAENILRDGEASLEAAATLLAHGRIDDAIPFLAEASNHPLLEADVDELTEHARTHQV